MALSNTVVRQTYNGNGSTTTFAIPFAVIEDDSVETAVYIRDESDPNNPTETLMVEGPLQDYTLTGANPPNTPFNTDVEFNTAPTANQKVIIIRVLTLTHDMNLSVNAQIPPESLEKKLNRAFALIQQLKEEINRVPRLRLSNPDFDTLLAQDTGALKLIQVNEDNNAFEFVSPTSLGAQLTGGFTGTLTSLIANSQTNAIVSGLVLDKDMYTSAFVVGELTRGNNSGHVLLSMRYVNNTWTVKEILSNHDIATGIVWDITSSGQVRYTSGAEGVGEFKFRMLRFEA